MMADFDHGAHLCVLFFSILSNLETAHVCRKQTFSTQFPRRRQCEIVICLHKPDRQRSCQSIVFTVYSV